MPIYDFKCPNCEFTLSDRKVSFNERENQICPDCQSKLVVDINSLKPNLIGVG